MPTFSAYFDESENEKTSVVAGVIGSHSQISHFNREWADLMQSSGVEFLQMKEFAHSKGQFVEWKGQEGRRKDFLSRAVGIIARRINFSVGIVLDRKAYSWARDSDESFRSFYVNEYTTVSFMSLLGTSKWAEKWNLADPVGYVFDRGNPKRADFQRAYDLAKATPHAIDFGLLSFADDKQVPALQAADLIAYELCKVYTDWNGDIKRMRGSMRSLLRQVPNEWKVASSRELKMVITAAHAISGESEDMK